MTDSVLALILARGGSKGLPRKNLLDLGGRPLISWTIEAAKSSRLVSRVVVSTDDPEIAEISRDFGAEVPFVRPADVSSDEATSEMALKHGVDWLEKTEGKPFDTLLYLQVTDPFRPFGIIDDVISALHEDPTLDTVFAAKRDYKNYWIEYGGGFSPLSQRGFAPRQKKQVILREDTGTACATRTRVIRAGERIGKNVKIIPYDYPIDFVDIHSQFDLNLANLIIERFGILPNVSKNDIEMGAQQS